MVTEKQNTDPFNVEFRIQWFFLFCLKDRASPFFQYLSYFIHIFTPLYVNILFSNLLDDDRSMVEMSFFTVNLYRKI